MEDVDNFEHGGVTADDTMGNEPVVTTLRKSDGVVASRNVNHGETGVDPFRNPVPKNPYRDTQNTILLYRKSGTIPDGSMTTDGATSANVRRLCFRLNSIYDILDGTQDTHLDATPTADTSDTATNIEIPCWRTYWASLYNYWSVIGCRYRVRFYTVTALDKAAFSIWTYHHGKDPPPLSYSGVRIPDWFRENYHRHCHKNIHALPATKETGNLTRKTVIHGGYKPGSIQHTVLEDEVAQVWHKVTEVPPMAEKCTMIISPTDEALLTVVGNGSVQVYYDLEIEYATQWKDLKSTYDWVIPTTLTPGQVQPFSEQTNL